LGNDPEALVGMVDHGDDFGAGGGDGPVLAQEVQGVIGVEAALEIEGQVEVQEGDWGCWAQAGTFGLEGLVPSVIGGQAGGAADVFLVVPSDLTLEQLVGGWVIGNPFVGEQRDQAPLKGVEAALDLAFGLRVGGDAMGYPQRGEGALELGMSVEAIGWGAVTKEGEAVGVEGSGGAKLFEGPPQVAEVAPSGVAGHKRAGDDFTGVVVGGEDERGIGVGGPPKMG
jgi:hypothetical protein